MLVLSLRLIADSLKVNIMYKFTIEFHGRTLGAIGIFYTIRDSVEAETKEKAILKLYDKYEHIQQTKFISIEKKD